MAQHPNARLTPKGRKMLVSRVGSGVSVAAVARQMGASCQTGTVKILAHFPTAPRPALRCGYPSSRVTPR